MTGRLEGTVALVTGASSGIGEATATALAAEGASVALAARRIGRLRSLSVRIRQDGGVAIPVKVDVASAEQAADAVEQTFSELGRLDVLINNAGLMLLGPTLGAPLEDWQRMLDVNVAGLLYCAHAALPHLLKGAKDGPRWVADLVNISSVAGRVVRRGSGVYNLTKHGVGAFSESLRQELAPQHVRVSLVEPGAVDTELRDHNRPEVREQIGRGSPTSTSSPLVTSLTRFSTSSPGPGTWPSTSSWCGRASRRISERSRTVPAPWSD
jgi:NADP-dependent 3-hydroxy acid dehydrogenase YdfG